MLKFLKKIDLGFLFCLFILIVGILVAIVSLISGRLSLSDISVPADFLLILVYLPGLFVLMALLKAWLPDRLIVKHLRHASGFKGSLYAFLLGSITPGPLYLSFPIAALLSKKGASSFNVALFVCAWSTLKLVEEIFELHFLGLRFMLLRLAITLPFVILTSFILGRLAPLSEKNH
ncbi:MAG TPA: permease [Candidatus Woesearchaeota archaeon]|nr:permease [Candidatus Woesearchaeota archaeon]